MTVISSDGVLLQDIYVNNSAPGVSLRFCNCSDDLLTQLGQDIQY